MFYSNGYLLREIKAVVIILLQPQDMCFCHFYIAPPFNMKYLSTYSITLHYRLHLII